MNFAPGNLSAQSVNADGDQSFASAGFAAPQRSSVVSLNTISTCTSSCTPPAAGGGLSGSCGFPDACNVTRASSPCGTVAVLPLTVAGVSAPRNASDE